MPEPLALPLVRAFEIYALVGVLVGGLFAFLWAARVDPDAKGAPLGFKLLIWPAAAALWPWALWRVFARPAMPEQRDAHRRVSRAAREAQA
ncbi:MAG: hypothetical protein R3F34_19430 [Planctomycetota bacterium]